MVAACFVDPLGLYLSYLFGGVLLAGMVGCRAIVSKLVPSEEQGTVMSAMSAIYAIAPMLGAYFYQELFEFSLLRAYPGLPFAGGSMVCVVAMLVLVVLDYSMGEQRSASTVVRPAAIVAR